MHQPIREHLEAYLRDCSAVPREFQVHLAACPACESALKRHAAHAAQIRSLRAGQSVEPRPGFYARVLTRIEEQRAASSFWSAFLEPALGKRLAYACATLVLLLGAYLVSTEPGASLIEQNAQPVVLTQTPSSSFADGTVQPRDRDAVLVNLASFQE